ncbi:hypothetical protein V5O48_015743 [Marasmius crinis-equi]|uniref:RNA helicase n=1 Tax=Marasmius crinis-equi TaxID=585013 RepID=A0ABR3ETM7_9AGAR
MSATLPACVRRDVLSRLQFGDNYAYINVGNDHSNVSLAVRAMQHPRSSFKDLNFIVPNGFAEASQIPKTFLYADNVVRGVDLEDHLIELLSPHLRSSGIIRTYSAAYTDQYRAKAIEQFREGVVRILICTNTAGMGCDLPDIELVMQWKLPKTVSSFIQRAGRAARAPSGVGLAVLLVERSAYAKSVTTLDNCAVAAKVQGEKGTGKGKAKGKKMKTMSAKEAKAHAVACGVNHSAYGGESDQVYVKDEPPLNKDMEDEGLLVLIQTGICRRRVLTKVFKNNESYEYKSNECGTETHQGSQPPVYPAAISVTPLYLTESALPRWPRRTKHDKL